VGRIRLAARCTPSYNQSRILVAKASLLDVPLDTSPPASAGHLRLIGRPHRVILGVILLVGAALRYYGLNWDFGSGLHPDERHVTSLVQALALPTSWAQFLSPGHVSPLEPGDFAYGSLPLYLYWIAGHVAAWLGSWVPGLSAWQSALGSGVFLTGRIVSAAAGVLTILVVYLLGLRLYGRMVGLLAAAFFAVCVLDVQLSHYLAVDTLATLFATLAVYACVCVVQQRRPVAFLWAGAWTGAALACKVSVLPLLLPLVVAPFLTGEAAPAADEAGASPDQATGARAQAIGDPLPPTRPAGEGAHSLRSLAPALRAACRLRGRAASGRWRPRRTAGPARAPGRA
jgi:Dolichyl-phosphate-mannose-protein mannosyltransferase